MVELAEQYGQPSDGGVELDLQLSQDELASLIAASRESGVRALTSLRRRGLIATGRRTINLRDIEGLRHYAP